MVTKLELQRLVMVLLRMLLILPSMKNSSSVVSVKDVAPGGGDRLDQQSRNESRATALMDRLLSLTDPRIRPDIYGPAVMVKCDFYVESFGPLDSTNMEFRMDTYFRQRWRDRRLAFTEQDDPVIVPAHSMDRLWLPELIFPNEKEGNIHQVTVPNKVIKIFPDGTVRYSARMKMVLACMMDLGNFPHDYQDCFIRVKIYTYTTRDVYLDWLNDKPVEIYTDELKMPEFRLLHIAHQHCADKLTTGDFSCIEASFHMGREVGYYVLQTYLPSFFIVIISWISFWINKEAVPARVTLGVTTVLTMTTQLAVSRSQTMNVSYPKAMDVWYATCMLFVFGALLEYALVNVLWRREHKSYLRRRQQNLGTLKESSGEGIKNIMERNAVISDTIHHVVPSICHEELDQGQGQGQGRHQRADHVSRVDHVSRIAFPLVFVALNLIYWPYYTVHNHGETDL